MKKNIVKIVLDIIMTVLLILMYSKNVISISFHEVGGLVVCGLFLIHKGLNWKWIVTVSKRLFDKSLPAKTRLGYIVNVLLFISTIFVALSGIMISKTIIIFRSISSEGMFWKMGHYFSAAILLVLVGVHIGLHWSFIKSMFGKMLKLPAAVVKSIGIICLAIVIIYGGYNTATTSFIRWLISPITAFTDSSSDMPQKGGGIQQGIGQKGQRPEGMRQKGEKPEGFVRPEGEAGREVELPGTSSLNFGGMINVIASYGSITAVFAALTVLIEKMLKKKKHNKV
jgi:uncharacterized protein YjeT (DUF2065 family)